MDNLTQEQRNKNMRRIRSTDTAPEMLIRKALHQAGFRYRLHRRELPGKPDLVFPGTRKAIFVHGCFWHQHPGCSRCTQPATRTDYWLPKLARNVARDDENRRALEEAGWQSLIIWECELKSLQNTLERVIAFLRPSDVCDNKIRLENVCP